jgi:hypothetical protein
VIASRFQLAYNAASGFRATTRRPSQEIPAMRFFNTAGPTNCQKHYCVPPLTRFSLDDILTLIDRERDFVLHAPRQVGKTTYLPAAGCSHPAAELFRDEFEIQRG